jgi:hypothetical protein
MKQVVTISPDGTISGLQRKPGQGLDLRKFGPCVVERASDIRATEDGQRWTVNLLTGPYAGKQLTIELAGHAGLFRGKGPGVDAHLETGGVLTFDDYDAAVRAEIATLDGLRLHGEF